MSARTPMSALIRPNVSIAERRVRRPVGQLALWLVLALASPAASAAATPVPCGPGPQITDAAGDGHHINTDVTAAWFAEDSGTGAVTAVIQANYAVWEPAHDDSDVAGFALLYSVGSGIRYVRAEAPRPPDAIRYDYGTWTKTGGFQSAGSTTGSAVAGSRGAVSIAVPAAAGAVAGTKLASPFVLTYDGVTGGVPHWVDRGPGGVTPDDGAERGADFIVGTCSTPPTPAVTAVSLGAASKVVGGGNVAVSGTVSPARAGVEVVLSLTAGATTTKRATTDSSGRFRVTVAVGRTTRLKAEAEGIASQTLTVRVIPVVRIAVKRVRSGLYRIEGTVRPALPGQVLLLRTNAFRATATARVVNGRFSFQLRNPVRGSYDAVYIPSGSTAERATSNRGVIK